MTGRETSATPALGPLVGLAGVVGLLLIAFAGGYGYHRDELYFLAAGDHLAWSYPDQGPLTPLVAHLMNVIAPGSLTVLRIPSALMAGRHGALIAGADRMSSSACQPASPADRGGLRGRRRVLLVRRPPAQHVDLRPARLDARHLARRRASAPGDRWLWLAVQARRRDGAPQQAADRVPARSHCSSRLLVCGPRALLRDPRPGSASSWRWDCGRRGSSGRRTTAGRSSMCPRRSPAGARAARSPAGPSCPSSSCSSALSSRPSGSPASWRLPPSRAPSRALLRGRLDPPRRGLPGHRRQAVLPRRHVPGAARRRSDRADAWLERGHRARAARCSPRRSSSAAWSRR